MEGPRSDLAVVLVIDEMPPVVRLIELELSFQGLQTKNHLLADDPVGTAESLRPDAIVLGAPIAHPHVFEVLAELKQRVFAPLVFINASGNEADAALALEMGADDVMDRPFDVGDLGLRLRSLLNQELSEPVVFKRGPLTIDYLRRVVWHGDRKLALTTNEWGLLIALAQANGRLTAQELLTNVWGSSYANEGRFLDIWIRRLRVNIGEDLNDPSIVLGDLERGFWLAS